MDNIINTLMELFFAWSRNKLVCAYIHVQLCLTLCDPMDCSPPGPSVYAVLQVRLLKWVAVSYSRESSQPRDQTHVFVSPALAGRFFTISTDLEAHRFALGLICCLGAEGIPASPLSSSPWPSWSHSSATTFPVLQLLTGNWWCQSLPNFLLRDLWEATSQAANASLGCLPCYPMAKMKQGKGW